ncbi:hypothetical protein Tco_0509300 [Tanacetum coccineum]
MRKAVEMLLEQINVASMFIEEEEGMSGGYRRARRLIWDEDRIVISKLEIKEKDVDHPCGAAAEVEEKKEMWL